MNLPLNFIEEMKNLLGNEFEDFYKSYENNSFSGLRVNRNKISVEEFIRIAPYDIKPVPFIENGFYINEEDEWSKHPYYFAGLYYLQEPSAMLPANRLFIEDNDKVLDLCAAPGGKSTELSSKGAGLLVSNDISYKRAIPLVKNLEVAGADNIYVTCEDPNKLSTVFNGFFDKILVDAPCSGEGMFRKDKSLISAYEKKGPMDYQTVQMDIIENAYKMLKPGGLIMYSTCTFSDIEDEQVIKYILDKYDDISICDIPMYDGFSGGYDKYTKEFREFSSCIHILPHKVKGEGHFLALLKKHKSKQIEDSNSFMEAGPDLSKEYWFTKNEGKNDYRSIKSKKSDKNRNSKVNSKATFTRSIVDYDELPFEVKEFMSNFSVKQQDIFSMRKYLRNADDFIYMLPECEYMYNIPSLRLLRTGLIIGEYSEKKGFIPHTAMALAKGNNTFINRLDLKANDEAVYKYLRGETLVFEDENLTKDIQKGFCLICVDGFSLGFAKYDGSRFKNLYEKGWRLI